MDDSELADIKAAIMDQWRSMAGMGAMFVSSILFGVFIQPFYNFEEMRAFGEELTVHRAQCREVGAERALAVGPRNVYAREVGLGVAEPLQHLRAGGKPQPDACTDSGLQPGPDVGDAAGGHGWVKVKCALNVVAPWTIPSSRTSRPR